MPSSLASLEALAGQESLSLLDRFKALRTVLDWVRSLNLDRHEIIQLSKLVVALFQGGITTEKFWAFIDALFDALESEPVVGALGGTAGDLAAVNWDSVLAFLVALFELLSKHFSGEPKAA